MRIISKFQDYYDSGLAYGIDSNVVYVREQEELSRTPDTSNENTRDRKMLTSWRTNRYFYEIDDKRERSYRNVFLTFCGKRYLGIECESHMPLLPFRERHGGYLYDPDTRFDYYWSSEAADAVSKLDRWVYHGEGVDDNVWGPQDDDWANYEYGAPVVLERPTWRCVEVIRNPSLKELDFKEVMDPYTAFQEISMYLAGPLSGWEDPDLSPEPTGAEKMTNKGMDPVYGFRKKPGGK